MVSGGWVGLDGESLLAPFPPLACSFPLAWGLRLAPGSAPRGLVLSLPEPPLVITSLQSFALTGLPLSVELLLAEDGTLMLSAGGAARS